MASFPLIKVTGSYTDVGRAIGVQMAPQIKETLKKHRDEVPNFDHYLSESQKYYTFTKSIFPQYIEEMEAIAIAAEVSPAEFFFNNNREVYDSAEIYDRTHDHCTIAVSFNQAGVIFGHNEDWDLSALSSLYLLQATINETTFLSLNYAGAVPGVAAGINNWGLIQGINDLYQTPGFGVPKNFLARAILESHSLKEARDLIQNTQKASGFNHVLVQGLEGLNIEISGNQVDVDEITSPAYVHTNHYLTALKSQETFHTASSLARYISAWELIKPGMDVIGMQSLLSDTTNALYPICRADETLSSLVFDTQNHIVYISHGHPCQNSYETYHLFA